MSINKKSLENLRKAFTWRRLIIIFTLGLIGGSGLLSAFLIYKYIFQTLDDANAVQVLRAGAMVDLIDSDSYDKMKKLIEVKAYLPNTASARNIFLFSSSTAPITTTVRCAQNTNPLACPRS